MKRYIFLIIVNVLFCNLLLAQTDVNPNGYNIFYYGTGQKASEGNMRNGQPDGYWKTYYVNGKTKSEGNRRNFQLDSIWVFYDENGDTTQKISYLRGKRNGFSYLYEKVSDTSMTKYLSAKELYIDDVKQGASYYYYPTGELFKIINYKDGNKDGVGKIFDRNGQVISLYRYRNDIQIDNEKINRTDAAGMKQGTWKTFYPNDRVKSEVTYLNGQVHGYTKEYNERGELMSTKLYEHGSVAVENAVQTSRAVVKETFYANGNIKTSGSFIDDKPVGLHREYSEQGDVLSAVTYDDSSRVAARGIVDSQGKRQGEWTFYSTDGKPRSQGTYKDNQRTGSWSYFFDNGTVEQRGEFRNGRYAGQWTWYYPNGKVLRQEDFENGREDGKYAEYDQNGNTIASGQYIEGLREGEWTFSVGYDIEKGSYAAGAKQGEWKQYYPNGELRFTGSYIADMPDGKHRYYYENGRMMLEAVYSNGVRTGTWRKFDTNGDLILTLTYQNDELVKIDGKKITSSQ